MCSNEEPYPSNSKNLQFLTKILHLDKPIGEFTHVLTAKKLCHYTSNFITKSSIYFKIAQQDNAVVRLTSNACTC